MPGAQCRFEVDSPFKPTGDQPTAIESLVKRLSSGADAVTLLGASDAGNAFVLAHVIACRKRTNYHLRQCLAST